MCIAQWVMLHCNNGSSHQHNKLDTSLFWACPACLLLAAAKWETRWLQHSTQDFEEMMTIPIRLSHSHSAFFDFLVWRVWPTTYSSRFVARRATDPCGMSLSVCERKNMLRVWACAGPCDLGGASCTVLLISSAEYHGWIRLQRFSTESLAMMLPFLV